ncbi:MAG: 4-hydroxy-3-methylbut-2-enyl diphosphate reductase [Cellulosilyticaceae bacterium]
MSKPEIIVAQTAGFCFGVKRAVNLAFDTDVTKQTYTLGPIIHNDSIIERLATKGIVSIDSIDDKAMDTLIIRAHGVPRTIYDQAKTKGIQLIDATCPYVRKIHKLVKSYDEKGYGIIVIGDANHPEIIGINGWAQDKCFIVKDKEDLMAQALPKDKQYLIVSQTTYKKEVVEKVVTFLEEEDYQITYIPTICSATKERQEEAQAIAKEVDAMIVIGSAFSSNTQKLYEICKNHCEQTACILDDEALSAEMVAGASKIGITAGASTPQDIIEKVIEKVVQIAQ